MVSGGKVDAQAWDCPTAGTAGAPFFCSKTPPPQLPDASSISVACPSRRNLSLMGTRDVPLIIRVGTRAEPVVIGAGLGLVTTHR